MISISLKIATILIRFVIMEIDDACEAFIAQCRKLDKAADDLINRIK